ncbi:LysR substrate-binding domain-containing protein [Xanthobacter sp. DSM 24535]|uniref:LysR substrate-binding domain-containing protein n=1 Tax=Roseixanthobacter psychrophilus TaxID=3119917 RepID=UPI00372BB0A8
MTMIPDLDIALVRTFLAIVDTGGLTSAGRVVGRTQPAITQQIKRLEDTLERPLFDQDRRHLRLTPDGEVFLEYARAILRLNDEARARFGAPDIHGAVTLGVPDLYAAYLLPQLLRRFARAHPHVEIEMRCMRSVHLYEAMQRDELDLVIATLQPDEKIGAVVRREPLTWVAGPHDLPEAEEVVPLAVLPPGSVYRQRALEALGRAGRRWTITSFSESLAGLQAAVFAGLAVSVFPRCAVQPGMRCPGPAEGLPDLPAIELVLHRRPMALSAAAEHLGDFVERELAQISPFHPTVVVDGSPSLPPRLGVVRG